MHLRQSQINISQLSLQSLIDIPTIFQQLLRRKIFYTQFILHYHRQFTIVHNFDLQCLMLPEIFVKVTNPRLLRLNFS